MPTTLPTEDHKTSYSTKAMRLASMVMSESSMSTICTHECSTRAVVGSGQLAGLITYFVADILAKMCSLWGAEISFCLPRLGDYRVVNETSA